MYQFREEDIYLGQQRRRSSEATNYKQRTTLHYTKGGLHIEIEKQNELQLKDPKRSETTTIIIDKKRKKKKNLNAKQINQ